MATLARAIELAATKHRGQSEKCTAAPYILHPLRVMANVDGDDAKMAAVLHDVVEDAGVTPDELRSLGFAETVVDAVLALSRRPGESYADFIVRCRTNRTARAVKLADLQDNFNLPRALVRPEKLEGDLARVRKYILSYKFLTDVIDESQFRAAMPAGE
jgi:(p)ppGpp synthase/HD superfamily hydrolase